MNDRPVIKVLKAEARAWVAVGVIFLVYWALR